MAPRKKTAATKPTSNENPVPAPQTPPKRPARMGRPPKLNEPAVDDPRYTVAERIPMLVKAGIPQAVAAGMVGIHPVTLREWHKRGMREAARMVAEETDEPDPAEGTYLAVSLEVIQAEAASQGRMILQWQDHGKKDWRAIQSFMSKRWPTEWGDVQTVELVGAGGGPIQVAAAPSFDELEMILTQAEARQRADVKKRALEVGEV